MSDEQVAAPVTGQAAPAPIPNSNVAVDNAEPFYSYKGPKGEEAYKSREELDKFMREHALRQSDYTRKTQEVANYRKQFDQERSKFSEEQKAFMEAKKRYDQWDQTLKTRPDIYQQLERLAQSPADPATVFDRSKEYADSKTQELAARLEAMEKEREEERTNREMEDVFGKMKTKYQDFDQDQILEWLDTLKDGKTENLIEALYHANKGRMSPLETEKRMTEKLQKKASAGIVPGKGAAPGGRPQFKSFDEAAQAALRDAGAG
jgi:hypothetical protein